MSSNNPAGKNQLKDRREWVLLLLYCHTGRYLTHQVTFIVSSTPEESVMTCDLQSFWVFVND